MTVAAILLTTLVVEVVLAAVKLGLVLSARKPLFTPTRKP